MADRPVKRCARTGCTNPVTGRRPEAIYCGNACNVAASKARTRLARLAAQETGQKQIADAIAKLRPAARRVVRALEAAPRHCATTDQLKHPLIGGGRFGARIFEIRRALEPRGIRLDTRRMSNGQSLYTLRLPQLELDVDTDPGAQA